MYAIIPLANAKQHTTKSSRTSFGSTSKYFAMPPHTPVNTLPSLILYNFLAAITSSLLADNLIIGPGCQQINKQVHNCKHHIAYHGASQEQLDIQKIEQCEQLVNDRECYCDMDPCDNQRQEKYRKHLRADRVLNLLMRHSNLLHNLISLFVIVAFGNLFVVNNQHRCHDE